MQYLDSKQKAYMNSSFKLSPYNETGRQDNVTKDVQMCCNVGGYS